MRSSPALASPPGGRLLALLLLGLMLIGAVYLWKRARTNARTAAASPAALIQPQLLEEVLTIERDEQEIARTIWAKELLAEQCGAVIEDVWDALNTNSDDFAVLSNVNFQQILIPAGFARVALPHGIERLRAGPAVVALNSAQWRARLAQWQGEGWTLDQSEWRHVAFDADSHDDPLRSEFAVSLHVSNAAHGARASIDGRLIVDWAVNPLPAPRPVLAGLRFDEATILRRSGQAPLATIDQRAISPFPKTAWIDPLIVEDLDGDGHSEVMLAARNLLLRQQASGTWRADELTPRHPGLIFTAVLADLSGDGQADLLMATRTGLVLLKGGRAGRFDQPAEIAWQAREELRYAQVLSCGDIDGDADLDVWLGQYKVPYQDGQMPRPYFDANDGHPAYLLRNRGDGQFDDTTIGSGLEPKRFRRTYSGSLVDLDDDGDLDLLVVSDFAGADLYANDGRGRFHDITAEWLDQPRAFGMAHAFSDLNGDGRLDLLMIGMNSATADRLERLRLERPGFEAWQRERGAVSYGNRLFLGQGQGFRQGSLSLDIARSGWSWGCSVFDLDNDRLPEVYIANGHATQMTVRDYETEFWLHDIYVGSSQPSPAVEAYFASKLPRTRGVGWSYGGHERNRLFLNRAGTNLVDVAHLFGVAFESDSRNVVTEDLDGDGRLDLLLTTFEIWPQMRQTLRIIRNALESNANWIGFRLTQTNGTLSPIGAIVTLRDDAGTQVRTVVTGDGYRSQHSASAHFGLGAAATVNAVEIRWPYGKTVKLDAPAINRWHTVGSPSR